MTDLPTVRRAAKRLKEGPKPAQPTIEDLVNQAIQRMLPEINRIVSEQLSGVEYPQPADRTEEVLAEVRSIKPPREQDLSPLHDAIKSLQVDPADPQGPVSYEMTVTEFDARNRPFKVRIDERTE